METCDWLHLLHSTSSIPNSAASLIFSLAFSTTGITRVTCTRCCGEENRKSMGGVIHASPASALFSLQRSVKFSFGLVILTCIDMCIPRLLVQHMPENNLTKRYILGLSVRFGTMLAAFVVFVCINGHQRTSMKHHIRIMQHENQRKLSQMIVAVVAYLVYKALAR
ncbi:unnamed protein product [Periconia digitata]|uniref:Uncharacterized protein n=1 Tax=Periconia digitata TaxID=1303443 RepID=A0A9W4XQA3_9PLEO|nr:unnamed protein product [Periconia digitata]